MYRRASKCHRFHFETHPNATQQMAPLQDSKATALVRRMMSPLSCPLCHKLLQEPESLPCQHHFCFQCLDRICDTASTSGPVCPVCKEPFWLRDRRSNQQLSNIMASYTSILGLLHLEPKGGESSHKQVTPTRGTSTPAHISVLPSGISQSSKKYLAQVCHDLGWSLEADMTPSLSAVVTRPGTPAATVHVLTAIAKGIPVVSLHWVDQCARARKTLPFNSYMLTSDAAKQDISHARIALYGHFYPPEPSREELKQLIGVLGATHVEILDSPTHVVCSNTASEDDDARIRSVTQVSPLHSKWLLDSLLGRDAEGQL